jgi:hypothetical protein
MSATRQHGRSPYRDALEMVLARPQRVGAPESLSFKQSWKDGHWYCDGISITPQDGETLADAYDRFLLFKARIDSDLGVFNARTADDEGGPF